MNTEIDSEAFDNAVRELAREAGVEALLSIPGVWELVSEEFNNEAIRKCEEESEETPAGYWSGERMEG